MSKVWEEIADDVIPAAHVVRLYTRPKIGFQEHFVWVYDSMAGRFPRVNGRVLPTCLLKTV